jgi:hypothetical protein
MPPFQQEGQSLMNGMGYIHQLYPPSIPEAGLANNIESSSGSCTCMLNSTNCLHISAIKQAQTGKARQLIATYAPCKLRHVVFDNACMSQLMTHILRATSMRAALH